MTDPAEPPRRAGARHVAALEDMHLQMCVFGTAVVVFSENQPPRLIEPDGTLVELTIGSRT